MAPNEQSLRRNAAEVGAYAVRSELLGLVPAAYMIALAEHETGRTFGDFPNRPVQRPTSAQGVWQQLPRYAGDHWPYELPPVEDREARARVITDDREAGAYAAADWLLTQYRKGERDRSEAGERTYRQHAQRHAATVAAKGGSVEDYPHTPTRWIRNPWLARYNRGSHGQWAMLHRPNRPDGSHYQVTIEGRAAEIEQKIAQSLALRTTCVPLSTTPSLYESAAYWWST